MLRSPVILAAEIRKSTGPARRAVVSAAASCRAPEARASRSVPPSRSLSLETPSGQPNNGLKQTRDLAPLDPRCLGLLRWADRMTKRREPAVAFLVGFTLTWATDFSARAVAQLQTHARPDLFSDAAQAEPFRMVPAILVAGACLHAVVFHSRRVMYFVLCCTLPAYAFWSYLGELGFHRSIAAGRWTGAALSRGLAWLASTVVVMLCIPLSFFLASWLEKRSALMRSSNATTKRVNWIVLPPALSDGAGSSFACSVCGATVNFGASHCGSCEEPFDYPKPSGRSP